ncbi:unnamed protein product [Tilletia laevis]|uniref:Major facilitator superfamily (MFS) profile domain-containing protein n=3 Tax=Tilletia TaxID=13289 RepID=A0A8X7SYF6_9BASI|nr:hypothetical protein CF328_g5478 [Tilletia controversa]KAE8195216.1 hypothetical protein CF335_g5147 [Tilletia laevis]KAE8256903.1 hypothetical protein A4X03_0g4940 [Tilletia caries]KAE8197171.1 hypothetical protein CF336_g2272 [Tilletia laevis]KAE8250072.1 hypothetical protein A4X06_0g2931 [Tilletia controversa]
MPKLESVLSGRLALAREIGTVIIVSLCMLFTQSGVGQAISTLDYVSRSFGIEDSPGNQSWLAASYSLLVGTLVLPMGSAGDLLGHKKLVVIGFAWFALWSLITGLSSYAGSHIFFDVCRGLQGAGPAMILPNGVAILGRMYRNGSLRKYISFCAFAATAPNGFLVAAAFSGIVVQETSVGWPLTFYLFAIVLFLVTIASIFILPDEDELLAIHRQHEEDDREKERDEREKQKLADNHGGGKKDVSRTPLDPNSILQRNDAETASVSSTGQHRSIVATPPETTDTDLIATTSARFDAAHDGNQSQARIIKVAQPGNDEEPVKPRFDWIGAFLGVSSLLLLNVAWNQGGVVGWQDPQTYILLIIGTLLGAAFVYSSFKLAQPLLPPDVWTGENALVLGCVALGWASFGLWCFYSWRIWLVIRQSSVLLSTAYMSPAAFTGIVAAFGTGYFLQAAGPGPVLVIAMCFFCLGNVLVGTMPAQQTYWAASFITMLLTPIGMDSSFPSASIIISDNLPHSRQGQAGSLVNTVINWSIAIGLGIGGTVERYITEDLRKNPNGLQPIEITFKGYRSAMYVGIGLSSLGVLLSLVNWVVIIRRNKAVKAQAKGGSGESVEMKTRAAH